MKSVHTQVTSCHVITSGLCTASDNIFYFCMYFSEKGDTRSYFYVLISYSRHDEKNKFGTGVPNFKEYAIIAVRNANSKDFNFTGLLSGYASFR